jgi:hypothetical protein
MKAVDRADFKASAANKSNKKKGKNIFKDDSDDESSDSEEEKAPYFKATKKAN